MFCVTVRPGKGSSQGSLTCPGAQGLLCAPVLEAYPLRSFRVLLEALQLETFSPLQSPAYTKGPGRSLKQRERAHVLAYSGRPTGIKTPGEVAIGGPAGDPGVMGCAHLPARAFAL